MTANQNPHQRIVLASRPSGAPNAENFRLESSNKPVASDGQVLLRTIYLSLDPYMRGRMSDAESYAEPVAVNDIMVGGTVCQVEESRHPDFEVGEWVLAYTGWQNYALSDGEGLLKLGKAPAAPHTPSESWACRVSPPIWDCWILASPKREKLWWLPPPPDRLALP